MRHKTKKKLISIEGINFNHFSKCLIRLSSHFSLDNVNSLGPNDREKPEYNAVDTVDFPRVDFNQILGIRIDFGVEFVG